MRQMNICGYPVQKFLGGVGSQKATPVICALPENGQGQRKIRAGWDRAFPPKRNLDGAPRLGAGACIFTAACASGIWVRVAFAKDDLQLLAPVFTQGDKFPIDFGREIAKDGHISGMYAQRWSSEQQAWRK